MEARCRVPEKPAAEIQELSGKRKTEGKLANHGKESVLIQSMRPESSDRNYVAGFSPTFANLSAASGRSLAMSSCR
jgi:hypothetical protein